MSGSLQQDNPQGAGRPCFRLCEGRGVDISGKFKGAHPEPGKGMAEPEAPCQVLGRKREKAVRVSMMTRGFVNQNINGEITEMDDEIKLFSPLFLNTYFLFLEIECSIVTFSLCFSCSNGSEGKALCE